LNAGWLARPHRTTGIPGAKHGGDPCGGIGAGTVVGGEHSDRVGGGSGTAGKPPFACIGAGKLQTAGGKAIVHASCPIMAGGKTVVDDSRTNMAGCKTVVDGCGAIVSGRTVVDNMAGCKTVVIQA